MAIAEQVCERVVCSLAPGDTLFFHCNLLHTSAPNAVQDDPRWVRFVLHDTSAPVLALCCIATTILLLTNGRVGTGTDLLLQHIAKHKTRPYIE